ncbi:MAG: PEP-utilizing enzyme [Oscillospiraceae bacterium]|nr:PEP-utilizing enzyme [Oscillospiraceae bacterium]
MIKNINELRVTNENINYGNKATVLGQLSGKFKVPQGVVLPENFFDDYLEYNNFSFTCDEYLGKNRKIQSFIRQSEFSQSQKSMIEDELCKYDLHKCQKLIVRSSAICEDTNKNSMAGMFVSSECSNITDGILSAIKECYCSLFSDKVLEYFNDNNLDVSLLKMAVIIQEYIEGVYSGVIFTADTKEHNPNVIFINYAEGKCSGFVDGSVKSYFLKINKDTKEIIESNCNGSSSNQLSEKLINSLTDTALSIEKELGFYSDIEWTYDGNDIYILQARPITTLKDKRADFKVEGKYKDDEWYLIESEPLRPLFENYFQIYFSAMDDGLLLTGYGSRYRTMKYINNYMYVSNVKMENEEELRKKAIERLKEMKDKGLAMFDDYCLPQLLAIKNPMDKYICNTNISDNDIADLVMLSLEYTKTALITHWEAVLGETYIYEFQKYLSEIYGNITTEQLYNLIYIKTFKTMERELLLEIADFFNNNSSMLEILNSSVYPLIVYERLKLSNDWDKLNEFIRNYLDVFEMDWAGRYNLPSYPLREKPQYAVENAKKIISQNRTEYLSSISELQNKKAKIKKHIFETIDKEYQEEFESKLSIAEKTFASIDNHHYYCEEIQWGYVKTALSIATNRLIENGSIETPEDIYYLDFYEICGLLRKTALHIDIKKRITEYEEKRRVSAPNRIISESAQQIEKNKAENSPDINSDNIKMLKGMASLNKTVRGTILIGPGVPNDIPDDCILVVWNGHAGDLFPIINKIKGLIVVEGSPFDHMGIITREINIPALYYVKNALTVLKTGDKVILDGENGIVEIL